MTFKEILAQCTGISSPIIGIQWQPPHLDIQIARDLVKDLEDRRVLYNPVEMEGPAHCLSSVNAIRQTLTTALKQAGKETPLERQLRAMRKACRRFENAIGSPGFDELDRVVQRSLLERELFVYGAPLEKRSARWCSPTDSTWKTTWPALSRSTTSKNS
jgi:hypothetical protein